MSQRTILKQIFEELSVLEGHQFKSRAYKNAAYTLSTMSDKVFDELESYLNFKGIGASINSKILEFKTTGRVEKLENLRQANKSYLDTELYKVRKSFVTKRIPYEEAKSIVEELIKVFTSYKDAHSDTYSEQLRCCFAGSYRRKKSYIADIDILAVNEAYEVIVNAFIEAGYEVLVQGDAKTSFKLNNAENTSIDVTKCSTAEYPFAVLHFTGSKEHNILMRKRAISMGFKLSQYGLTGSNERAKKMLENTSFTSEKDIFTFLNMPYVNPENR